MNIRDLKPNASQADQLRNSGVGKTYRPDAQQSARKAAETGSVARGDSVEISDAARQAAEKASGVDFARRALLGIPPLNEERAADILKRIQAGYYSQPEVVDQIAKGVVKDMTGRE